MPTTRGALIVAMIARTGTVEGDVKPLVVLVLLLGLLAGCGGTKTVTVTQTVTKTVTKTVTTTAAPSAAAACSGADLSGSFARGPRERRGRSDQLRADADELVGVGLLRLGNPAAPAPRRAGRRIVDGRVGRAAGSGDHGEDRAPGPGAAATAPARFSPDVPGVGEQSQGACEPTAHQLKVTIGGGSVTVPVSPPTPCCEHGALRLSVLAAA